MSDDTEMLAVRVPAALKEAVDRHQKTNQELVRMALWQHVGGEDQAEIRKRIDELEERIAGIRRERNERERELEEKQEMLEMFESKLETTQTMQSDKEREQLQKLHMVPNDPEHMLVQEVAENLGMTPEEALSESEALRGDD